MNAQPALISRIMNVLIFLLARLASIGMMLKIFANLVGITVHSVRTPPVFVRNALIEATSLMDLIASALILNSILAQDAPIMLLVATVHMLTIPQTLVWIAVLTV